MKQGLMNEDREKKDRDLFNRISQHYVRKDLMPASRAARQLRLNQTLRHGPAFSAPDVLEVGCGGGFAADYLKGIYGTYLGIDYADELIRYAQVKNASPEASFQAINAKDLPTDQKFDIIFMIGVLHHLDNPDAVLQQLSDSLKPGGWMIANEPQRNNPLIQSMRYIRRKIDRQYSEDQIEYSKSELTQLFHTAGYEGIEVHPQGIFSTPFAEVIMPLQPISYPIASLTCHIDRWLERRAPRAMQYISWNLIVQGRKQH